MTAMDLSMIVLGAAGFAVNIACIIIGLKLTRTKRVTAVASSNPARAEESGVSLAKKIGHWIKGDEEE